MKIFTYILLVIIAGNAPAANVTNLVAGNSVVIGDLWSTIPSASGGATNITSGLVGWWKMDDGSGATAVDSASTNNGTLVNSPSWVTGQIGSGALNFNGNTQYVSVANNSTIDFPDTKDMTISVWIKTSVGNNGGSYCKIIVKRTGTQWYTIQLLKSSGVVYFEYNGGATLTDTSSLSLIDNTWHQIIVTVDRSINTAKIYVDGVLKNTNTSFTANMSNTANLQFGAYSTLASTEDFNGSMDDIRFYNRALSSGEVSNLFLYRP